MIQVHASIAIGTLYDCGDKSREPMPTIHACKFPCHRNAVGYRQDCDRHHPHYLSKQDGADLYLNIVDPPYPLFKIETFLTALNFIDDQLEAGAETVLIHCNKGLSRAPSIALLWLAKRLDPLPDTTYAHARAEFLPLYPTYEPGTGIARFLADNWKDLSRERVAT